ncbi:7270_t:CDS:2, partial [Paraglomus occultum]
MECKEGHIWLAPLHRIKNRGTWCQYCADNRNRLNLEVAIEIGNSKGGLCREIVSKYLGPPSKIRRPDLLKVSKCFIGLELDIYYPEYGFAIEVQGEQHEKYIEFFHRGDPNNFIKQQERDQLKKELCEENWIVL